MKLLLDTHTLLWYIGNDPQLSVTAKALVDDMDNEIVLSVGSLWEIAIKFEPWETESDPAIRHIHSTANRHKFNVFARYHRCSCGDGFGVAISPP